MRKNIQKILFSFFLAFLLLGFCGYALAFDALKDTGLLTTSQVGYTGAEGKRLSDEGIMLSIPQAIGSTVGTALSLLGVAFMLLIIYGGFIWMFARGNDQAVAKAKSVIEAAVVGLVIVLAAYAITAFIGTSLTT